MKRFERHARFFATAVTGSAMFALLLASSASAHENVKAGKVEFEIGFLNEPAYAGFQNGVFLAIQDGSGHPVTDAAETLTVTVVFGDQRMEVPLEPRFDADAGGGPGQYVAAFIPTRPGAYTFQLFGTLAGQRIDGEFTSSPKTFDEVVDPTSVEFPVKDPTLGQVAERLNREFPRINGRIAAAQQSATDTADDAETLAYIAVGLAALGLIVSLVAGSRRRAS